MRQSGSLTKLGLLATLYLSQGLPYGFFSQALPVLLRERGAALSVVGLSSLLALPWALKFLWAARADRADGVWFGRSLGRRRGWILPLQGGLAVLFAGAALTEDASLAWLLALAFLANALGAAQDTATDGLAVEILSERERGLGNGVQVAGYRVGMILGGGGLLILLARWGWRTAFAAAAGVLLVASAPIWRYRESRSTGLGESGGGWLDALRRPGMAGWAATAAAYKFGDAGASAMVRPLLVDVGCSLEQVGALLGVGGFTAGLVGALFGGWATGKIGRARALLGFGLVQAAAVGGYVWIEPASPAWLLWTVSIAEHFCGGMATAALFTAMMDRSRVEHASTDYTLQACAVVVGSGAAATLSGFVAESVGYAGLFRLYAVASTAAAVWAWAAWRRF